MEEKTYIEIAEEALLEIARSDSSMASRLNSLYRLIDFVFASLGEGSGLHFPTLFSRIAHFSTVLELSPRITRGLHQFRLFVKDHSDDDSTLPEDEAERWFSNGVVLASAVLRGLAPDSDTLLREEVLSKYELHLEEGPASGREYRRHMRFIGLDYNATESKVSGKIEPDGRSALLVLNESGRADLYRDNVKDAVGTIGLPITMSLVDVECDENMNLSPRMVVIEPDYLVDVTSVADCFQSAGADSRVALLKSFMPREWSGPLLMGAIANFLLDEIIRKPDVEFNDLLQSIFKLHPIAFTRMNDTEVQDLIRSARSHFITLKKVVESDFETIGVNREKALIEPTYYAPVFGLQGRLDLYHRGEGESSTIIELKSGKPFMQNNYGLNNTHYIQTLLYHLLLRAVSDFKEKPLAYILYSGQTTQPLRNAPVVGSLQREAIRVRNKVVLDQVQWLSEGASLKSFMEPSTFKGITGFLKRDVNRLSSGMSSLSSIETSYFRQMHRLVVGEQFMAKLGSRSGRQHNGLAGIWLLSDQEKEESFSLLKELNIEDEGNDERTDGQPSPHARRLQAG